MNKCMISWSCTVFRVQLPADVDLTAGDLLRRDFTMNALFYDPAKEEVLDLTGMGVDDINRKVVRAIGVPEVRFAEDPVRMLRALKMVAQFDFSLDDSTENALFASLPQLM